MESGCSTWRKGNFKTSNILRSHHVVYKPAHVSFTLHAVLNDKTATKEGVPGKFGLVTLHSKATSRAVSHPNPPNPQHSTKICAMISCYILASDELNEQDSELN